MIRVDASKYIGRESNLWIISQTYSPWDIYWAATQVNPTSSGPYRIYNYLRTRNNTRTVRCRWFESLGKVHTKRMPWAYRVLRIQPKYIGLWRARDCLCDLEQGRPEYTTFNRWWADGMGKSSQMGPPYWFFPWSQSIEYDYQLISTKIKRYINIPIPSQVLFPKTSLQISLVRTPSEPC